MTDHIIICHKSAKSENFFIYFDIFTADIYEEVSSSLQPLGLDTECLGGGRIAHNPKAKPQIKVYGYSQVGRFMAGEGDCSFN